MTTDSVVEKIEALGLVLPQEMQLPAGIVAKVALVHHDHHRHAVGEWLVYFFRLRRARVLYPKNGVGAFERLARAPDALFLDALRIVAQTGGIDELYRKSVDVELLADVARRSRGREMNDCCHANSTIVLGIRPASSGVCSLRRLPTLSKMGESVFGCERLVGVAVAR